MRRRRAVDRHRNLAVDDSHRQLFLRAGKAHRDAVLADQEGPRGQLLDDLLKCTGIRDRTVAGLAAWLLQRDAEGACQIVAGLGYQAERALRRCTERACHGAQRFAFRQEIHQPGKNLVPVVGLWPDRHSQRDREALSR